MVKQPSAIVAALVLPILASAYPNASVPVLARCDEPSVSCFQDYAFTYLDEVLEDTRHFSIIGGMLNFTRNNQSYGRENDVDGGDSGRSFEGSLRDKFLKFLLTHDTEVRLFEGAGVRISPRRMESDGLVARLEMLGGGAVESRELKSTPRIFFKLIKKKIGQKLMNALLAIALVLALIKIKLLWFLPMIMGVAAAKKLLLKVALFFFPALSWLFKLCPYYGHSPSKLHHHHHHVSHLHHSVPSFHNLHHHPDKHPHHNHHHHPPPHIEAHLEEPEGEFVDGPGFGPEFFLHRKKDHKSPVALLGDENDAHSWTSSFLGGQSHGSSKYNSKRKKKPQMHRPLSPQEIEALATRAEQQALLKVRLQHEHQRMEAENRRLQEQLQQSIKMQEKLKFQIPPNLPSSHPHPMEVAPQKSYPISFKDRFVRPDVTATTLEQDAFPVYDAFYSPILEKIDKVLNGVGYTDEPCRERLICSMYKEPEKYSPHSNLVSAELSREAKDLQKPTSTNAAVVRFYKYVQAARDGQDQRDCERLYPSCPTDVEL